MAAISGKSGRVYANALLVEDCEDAWNEVATAGVAVSTVTGKTGNAVRATTTTVGATTLLMAEAISKDLTGYDAITLWIRSSVNTSAGDLRILLDDTAQCASALENLSVPALTADTWRLITLRLSDPSLLGAVISIGLYQQTDLADGTFDIDAVYALTEIQGIKNWSIDYNVDALDATDFVDNGAASFVPGKSQWSGSFDGDKDGAPLSVGGLTYLSFGESLTNTQNWIGQAILTGISASTSHDGLVTYSYSFQGSGPLEVPTA